jgi:ketosteroid isomerase-like protein
MSAQENEGATLRFYDRVLSGDAEGAIADFMAPDTVWENPLPAPIPYGGRFEGAEGAGRYLGLVFETLDIEAFDIDEVIAARDRVVVLGRERARVRKTGRRYSGHWVHVLRFRDGRVRHLREYNDTAEMLSAFA